MLFVVTGIVIVAIFKLLPVNFTVMNNDFDTKYKNDKHAVEHF